MANLAWLGLGILLILGGACLGMRAIWRALPKDDAHDEDMKQLLRERDVEESKRGWQ